MQKIDNLQSDVQYLITKTNHMELESAERTKCLQEKNIKTKELKQLMKQARVTPKASEDPVPKVRKVKAERDKLKEEYMEYVKNEEEYFQKDPQTLPGIVFLHDSVIEEYGVCPYINIDCESEEIHQKRSDWLTLQEDKGATYFKLYEQLFSTKETEELEARLLTIESQLLDTINKSLDSSQMEIYNATLQSFVCYCDCKIKTKIMKERLKGIVHNLSILKAESGLHIQEYWGAKYSVPVEVNELTSLAPTKHDFYLVEVFNKLLEEYKEAIDNIHTHKKFKDNTQRYLRNELYLFLTNQKVFSSHRTVVAQQPGKYFRRWAILSKEEIDERFFSYAVYYIDKTIHNPSPNAETKALLLENLSKLLQESYQSKEMIYRDLKWNTTKGMIEHIKTLSYDKDNSKFILKSSKSHLSVKTTKSLSKRTVITKESEKVMNEEMLYFIVDLLKKDKDKDAPNETDHANVLERIKTKLRLKKINNSDKGVIEQKLKEMYQVIKFNSK
jgi:hypothetical protein